MYTGESRADRHQSHYMTKASANGEWAVDCYLCFDYENNHEKWSQAAVLPNWTVRNLLSFVQDAAGLKSSLLSSRYGVFLHQKRGKDVASRCFRPVSLDHRVDMYAVNSQAVFRQIENHEVVVTVQLHKSCSLAQLPPLSFVMRGNETLLSFVDHFCLSNGLDRQSFSAFFEDLSAVSPKSQDFCVKSEKNHVVFVSYISEYHLLKESKSNEVPKKEEVISKDKIDYVRIINAQGIEEVDLIKNLLLLQINDFEMEKAKFVEQEKEFSKFKAKTKDEFKLLAQLKIRGEEKLIRERKLLEENIELQRTLEQQNKKASMTLSIQEIANESRRLELDKKEEEFQQYVHMHSTSTSMCKKDMNDSADEFFINSFERMTETIAAIETSLVRVSVQQRDQKISADQAFSNILEELLGTIITTENALGLICASRQEQRRATDESLMNGFEKLAETVSATENALGLICASRQEQRRATDESLMNGFEKLAETVSATENALQSISVYQKDCDRQQILRAGSLKKMQSCATHMTKSPPFGNKAHDEMKQIIFCRDSLIATSEGKLRRALFIPGGKKVPTGLASVVDYTIMVMSRMRDVVCKNREKQVDLDTKAEILMRKASALKKWERNILQWHKTTQNSIFLMRNITEMNANFWRGEMDFVFNSINLAADHDTAEIAQDFDTDIESAKEYLRCYIINYAESFNLVHSSQAVADVVVDFFYPHLNKRCLPEDRESGYLYNVLSWAHAFLDLSERTMDEPESTILAAFNLYKKLLVKFPSQAALMVSFCHVKMAPSDFFHVCSRCSVNEVLALCTGTNDFCDFFAENSLWARPS